MKPYYQDNAVTIYHGDCRDILPKIGHIDVTMTDPPYGVGVEYGVFDDTEDNVRNLVSDVMPVILGMSDVVCLTCATRQIGFYPTPTWILCWLNRAGAGMNPWGFTCWQPILVYGKDPYLRDRKGSMHDVIEHNECTSKSMKQDHPCPKPERFWMKVLNRISTRSTDIICDPFLGSGTTLRVAKDLNRKAIGIDVDEKYCEVAAKRMAQEVLPF